MNFVVFFYTFRISSSSEVQMDLVVEVMVDLEIVGAKVVVADER